MRFKPIWPHFRRQKETICYALYGHRLSGVNIITPPIRNAKKRYAENVIAAMSESDAPQIDNRLSSRARRIFSP